MKQAPPVVLFALFDAAAAIDGAMLVLFERHPPEAPAAFRAWCEEHGRAFAERTNVAERDGREYTVLGLQDELRFDISIHLESTPSRRAA